MGWMVLRLLLCCTATIAVVVHGRFVGWVTYVGGWWMGRWVDCICLPKAPGQEMGKVMSFLRTKLSLTSTPCTNQIRAMSCNTTCKVDMISQQQRRYCCWADREQTQSVLRTRSYYHTTLQRCCRPAAAGGNTMRVKRLIRGVSEVTIHHREKGTAGGADACMYPGHTAPSLTATRTTKGTVSSAVCSSVSPLLCW